MPVPTAISELSTTPGSNSPSGADSPSVLDDHQRTAYAFIRTLSDAKLDASSGVTLTGNQTIAGTKTFSSPIAGSVTGSAHGNGAMMGAGLTEAQPPHAAARQTNRIGDRFRICLILQLAGNRITFGLPCLPGAFGTGLRGYGVDL